MAIGLLDRVDRIRHIPAFAVHGRYDIVCPVRNLDDLRRAWPELDSEIVPDAGHSSHEAGITRELVAATRRIAATGTPVRPESRS
jgi:proline iminopeptidase